MDRNGMSYLQWFVGYFLLGKFRSYKPRTDIGDWWRRRQLDSRTRGWCGEDRHVLQVFYFPKLANNFPLVVFRNPQIELFSYSNLLRWEEKHQKKKRENTIFPVQNFRSSGLQYDGKVGSPGLCRFQKSHRLLSLLSPRETSIDLFTPWATFLDLLTG